MANIKKSNEDWKLDSLYRTLDRNTHWISHADNKASILITFTTLLYAGSLFFSQVTNVLGNEEISVLWRFIISILSIAYGVSFLLSFIFLLIVLISRINKETKNSLVFFNDISSCSLESFKESYENMNETNLIEHILEQVHTTSMIASKKFTLLKYSYICISISLSMLIMISFLIQIIS